MPDLPGRLQQIRDSEADTPSAAWSHAQHHVQFVYGHDDDEVDLALFSADGPIHIPAEGQVVRVHGVPVKCLRVDVSYETTEEGTPAVFVTVHVDAADTASTSD